MLNDLPDAPRPPAKQVAAAPTVVSIGLRCDKMATVYFGDAEVAIGCGTEPVHRWCLPEGWAT